MADNLGYTGREVTHEPDIGMRRSNPCFAKAPESAVEKRRIDSLSLFERNIEQRGYLVQDLRCRDRVDRRLRCGHIFGSKRLRATVAVSIRLVVLLEFDRNALVTGMGWIRTCVSGALCPCRYCFGRERRTCKHLPARHSVQTLPLGVAD